MFIVSDSKKTYKKRSHKGVINNIKKRTKTYKNNDNFKDGLQNSKSNKIHNSTSIRNIKTRKNGSDKGKLDSHSHTPFNDKMNSLNLDKNKVIIDNIKKRTETYKYKDHFENGLKNSKSITINKSTIIHSTKTRKNASDKSKLNLHSYSPFDSKRNSLYLDKNISVKDVNMEIFTKPTKNILTSRNIYELSYKKLIQENMKARNKKVIYNNKLNGLHTSPFKYRIMRTPGCWKPIFLLIIRDSNNDLLLPNNFINKTMSYLIFEKSDTIQDIQYGILNNYSLI